MKIRIMIDFELQDIEESFNSDKRGFTSPSGN